MGEFKIKKGLDLPLAGRPTDVLSDAAFPPKAAVYPSAYPELKPRLEVEVGSVVERGSVLFTCKRHAGLRFCSPAAGRISAINLGERRSIREIVIETDPANTATRFDKYSVDEVLKLERDAIVDHLLATGYITMIRQRPFSRIADAAVTPKSIFVNAMQTAPFGADIEVALKGEETAFQTGLNLLTRLTEGPVFLNIHSDSEAGALLNAKNAEVNSFSGPHPSGNSSVHIAKLDPIAPSEAVWVLNALDLILIGKLFAEGELPARQTIALAGPGVKAEARRHYRVARGGWLEDLLLPSLADGEQRIINGDILTGEQISLASGLPSQSAGITVINEERERQFLGWLAPGLDVFSTSPLFLSRWLRPNAKWNLTTADHGGKRAMFATGIYDKVMPLNIMVDFLLRAIIAHETEDAVKMGILEVDPEDFALCSYLCPSRTDVVGLIRQGLEEIEAEGVYTQEQE